MRHSTQQHFDMTDPRERLVSVTGHGDSASLSATSYEAGVGFMVTFGPSHLPRLRQLVQMLEAMERSQRISKGVEQAEQQDVGTAESKP